MPKDKLQTRLLNLQFQPVGLFPWGPDHSVPAGVVLRYPDKRAILIGHDIHGSTSAHFIGGIPWKDELANHPGLTWAWLFNE